MNISLYWRFQRLYSDSEELADWLLDSGCVGSLQQIGFFSPTLDSYGESTWFRVNFILFRHYVAEASLEPFFVCLFVF